MNAGDLRELRDVIQHKMRCSCGLQMLIVDKFLVCENGCGKLVPVAPYDIADVAKAFPERLIARRKLSARESRLDTYPLMGVASVSNQVVHSKTGNMFCGSEVVACGKQASAVPSGPRWLCTCFDYFRSVGERPAQAAKLVEANEKAVDRKSIPPEAYQNRAV